jgi:hypothetical protein
MSRLAGSTSVGNILLQWRHRVRCTTVDQLVEKLNSSKIKYSFPSITAQEVTSYENGELHPTASFLAFLHCSETTNMDIDTVSEIMTLILREKKIKLLLDFEKAKNNCNC